MIRAYTVDELLQVEDPEWLVDGVIPLNALAALYGQPGDGKSFLALDLALCVASGLPWQGHTVPTKGYVVYVSAEGSGGLKKRVAAWLAHHGLTGTLVGAVAAHFLLSAISVTPDSQELVDILDKSIHPAMVESHLEVGLNPNEDIAPLFIIVDTLARCFEGDENQQEDMGNFIKGLDTLRERYNATILVLHHSGKMDRYEPRGSSSFKGACDVMMQVEKKDKELTLTCTKQKDYEAFAPMVFELEVVEAFDTCVIVPSEASNQEQAMKDRMLAVLRDIQPARWNDWINACDVEGHAHRLVQLLMREKAVAKDENKMWGVTK